MAICISPGICNLYRDNRMSWLYPHSFNLWLRIIVQKKFLEKILQIDAYIIENGWVVIFLGAEKVWNRDFQNC